MSAVILRDEIVHYEVLGRGRPLVFLHGWVGSWRYWIPTMQAASISFRTYAIDLWGYGDSAKNPTKYSISQQADLLVDFMDKLGIMRIALVGHGLGAVVALEFAAHNPGLVDRVLAIGYPLDRAEINPRLRSSTTSELADWLLGRLPAFEAARVEAPKADYQAIIASLGDIQDSDLRELASRLKTPCLFVHGQNDPLLVTPQFDDYATLPEGCGHFPMLDETSKFNRLLVDFLALDSGESPRQLQLKEEWKRRVR
jgi:pimeloyl-ACP methyl ester carboxylesterase